MSEFLIGTLWALGYFFVGAVCRMVFRGMEVYAKNDSAYWTLDPYKIKGSEKYNEAMSTDLAIFIFWPIFLVILVIYLIYLFVIKMPIIAFFEVHRAKDKLEDQDQEQGQDEG